MRLTTANVGAGAVVVAVALWLYRWGGLDLDGEGTSMANPASRAKAAASTVAMVLATALTARILYVQSTKANEIVYNQQSERSRWLVQKIKHVASTYATPWWAPTGVLQTIIAEFMPSEDELAKSFRRETLRLPEMKKRPESTCCPEVVPAGVVSVDWLDNGRPSTAPIILLVPGLTGSSESAFVRRAAKHFVEAGFRVACYNPRGRGGNPLESPFLYSAGFTEDIRRVVKHLRESNEDAVGFFAAGYSLGSNYLAKFVGEEGDACMLDGAACLACPVDCLSITHSLNTTLSGRIMDPVLVHFVKRMAAHHREVLERAPELFDFVQMEETRTMQHFDGVMTAPSFGFGTASDYYRYASSGLVLHRIARPTLFVSARNDPICPGTSIQMDNFEHNENLISVRTAGGGHSMDWPTAGLESWSAKVLVQYFSALASERAHPSSE